MSRVDVHHLGEHEGIAVAFAGVEIEHDHHRAESDPVVARIGKQGGRRLYLPGLVREFGTVWVHGETAETSRYEFRQGGRRVIVEFLMDGERRDFGISLASIVGKYLREGAMRLFNDYWARQREGLRATAGYGLDAPERV